MSNRDMPDDIVSAKVLEQSRNRLLTGLADAFAGVASQEQFRHRAAELLDEFSTETREVCIRMSNARTGEVQNQRVDIRGIVPSVDTVNTLVRWGAWLYSKGWDCIEFDTTVKVTRAEHITPWVYPPLEKKKKT